MAAFNEVVLFERGKVKITNRRVIAQDQGSYLLSELDSVEFGRKGPAALRWLRQAVALTIKDEFVVRLETTTHRSKIVCETGSRVDAELIARAIRVAMLVGTDAPGFRAVFYHPPLQGEAEPEIESNWNRYDGPDLF